MALRPDLSRREYSSLTIFNWRKATWKNMKTSLRRNSPMKTSPLRPSFNREPEDSRERTPRFSICNTSVNSFKWRVLSTGDGSKHTNLFTLLDLCVSSRCRVHDKPLMNCFKRRLLSKGRAQKKQIRGGNSSLRREDSERHLKLRKTMKASQHKFQN